MSAAAAARAREAKIDAGMTKLQDAQKHGYLLGIKEIAGVLPRREIDDLLLNDPDAFNLYILALKDMQREERSKDMFGWYRLAGIHGVPKEYWDNVTGDGVKVIAESKQKKEGDENESGYCNHSTVRFPSWHRPYMCLLEQTLFIQMMEIANSYTGNARSRYRAAVLRFRLPYWDMFKPRDRGYTAFPGIKLPSAIGDDQANTQSGFDYDFKVPYIFQAEKIMVKVAPKDEYQLVTNPLYSFTFPIDGGMAQSDWNVLGEEDGASFLKWTTVRFPTANRPLGDVDRQNLVVNKSREAGVIYTLNLMTSDLYKNFETFATDDADAGTLPGTMNSGERKAGAKVSGSIEGFHNSWHATIGGSLSHMSRVATAAFDPIFWLFHCNIERYHTIYENINPDTFITNDEDLDYPLLPFRKTSRDNPTFWTSRNVRDTEAVFGYTYSDCVFQNEPAPKTMEEKLARGVRIKDRFKHNHEWSRRMSEVEGFKAPPKEMQPIDVSNAQVFDYLTRLSKLSTVKKADRAELDPGYIAASQKAVSGTVPTAWEWYVDMKVDRMAMNKGFDIMFFLGTPQVKMRDWELAPNMAGSAYIFAPPVEACDNCGVKAANGPHLITNTAPITPLLLDFKDIGKLKSLNESDVLPFLKESEYKLKFIILDENGNAVAPEDSRLKPTLNVGVSAKVTQMPRDRNAPVYKDWPNVGVSLQESEIKY